MRKLAAILIMGILLFNWAGYRAVFSYMETHLSNDLNQRLDNNHYEENALITIKVPVDQLPYYTNSPIFERVKGNVTIGSVTYQYVERRIFNDSLEMRCIPNNEVTHLTNARDEFFQLVNDLQHTSSSGKQQPVKQAISLKNIFSDYLMDETRPGYEPRFTSRATCYNLFAEQFCNRNTPPQEQPPDFC
ncbi:hypothetical protein ACFSQD_15100 [Flavihumibacter stibioxidans]|nr:hypothetical protein [Flavihumibacter stibioxidans]